MNKREPLYIGEALKRLRMTKRQTQEDLAGNSTLDRKSISQLEGNHQEPRLSTLYALTDGLEMEFLDFMKEINDELVENGSVKKNPKED